MSILTTERLNKLVALLNKGHVCNYPGLLKASHQALREQSERRLELLRRVLPKLDEVAETALSDCDNYIIDSPEHIDAMFHAALLETLVQDIRAEVEDADKT